MTCLPFTPSIINSWWSCLSVRCCPTTTIFMLLEYYNLADKVDGFHGFGNFLQPESAAALLALPLLSERITNELENLLLSSFNFDIFGELEERKLFMDDFCTICTHRNVRKRWRKLDNHKIQSLEKKCKNYTSTQKRSHYILVYYPGALNDLLSFIIMASCFYLLW